MAESVETAIYRLQVEGMEQIARLTKHVDGLAVAEEKATASTRTFSQGLQTSIARGDETVRGLENIRKALESYERYAEAGRGTQQQLAAYYDITNQKVAAQTTKLEELAVATENVRRAQANLAAGPGGAVGGAGGAATYAAEFEKMMTISEGKAAQIGKNFGIELDERMIAGTTKAARDSAAVFSAELDKINQIAHLKAQQAGKNFQDSLNASFGIGAGPAKSARESMSVFAEAGMIPVASKNMEQLGSTTKAARYEMINLSRQFQDVGVSLASGQSPLMILIQQGSQVYDVFASSERKAGDIFKSMGSALLSFVTNPLTLAIAGVAALTAGALALANAWDKAQVASQRAVSGAGARTGTTITDINQFVGQQSASFGSGTGLSQKETRALAEGLTQTGDIVIAKMHDMGNAVMGFANQTGKSVDDAIKDFVRFGTDPVKALDELEKAFGPVSQSVRDAAEAAKIAGDKTGAFNIVLDAMADKAKDAAQNMGVLEKAARATINALAMESGKPVGPEKRLENATAALNKILQIMPDMLDPDAITAYENELRKLNKSFEDTYAAMQKVIAARVGDQFNALAKNADIATNALIPQIDQLKKLEQQYQQLQRAKDAGVGGPNIDAAITANRNLAAATQQSMEQAERYNERVKEIGKSWSDVGQKTALALEALKNQLPVSAAVGGAAQMAAQAAADYANAMLDGKTATEAAAEAALKLANVQAQKNAASQEAVWQLQNQAKIIEQTTGLIQGQNYSVAEYNKLASELTGTKKLEAIEQGKINQLVHDGVAPEQAAAQAAAEKAKSIQEANANALSRLRSLQEELTMAQAVTHAQEMQVTFQKTFNDLINSGVKEELALAVAAKEFEVATAKVDKNIYKQVQSLKDAAAMTRAQADGSEAATAGAIAYRNAIDDGASATAAAALEAATLDKYLAQADAHAQSMSRATKEIAERLTQRAWEHEFDPKVMPSGTLDFVADPRMQMSYRGGGTGRRLDVGYGTVGNLLLAQGQATIDPITGKLIAKPAENATAATDLKNSIDDLKTSTDDLRKSNEDLLSPYYTQDPRTSHIGFRSQGMALGGYVEVPGGYSTNDNLIASIPVASGERIYVDPMGDKRGISSGSTTTINISSPVLIQGNANKDEIGRTLFQNNQMLAKQFRAATQ